MEIQQIDPSLHTLIAKAIQTSTREVFSTMLSLEIEPGEMRVESKPPSAQSGMVALIGLAGQWSGTGSLACSGEFACQMAANFLATSYEHVNEEVFDALGEIANMIIGNVKAALEEKLGPMGLSTPTIIYGRNLQTRGAHIHDWTVVPFHCGAERMYVQVCVAPNTKWERSNMPAGFQLPLVVPVQGI